MRIFYFSLMVGGFALSVWARYSLPSGTVDFPVPVVNRTHRGPYRWLQHPMYAGTVLLVTGMGGLGGGAWTALALFTLSELLTREWAWRESHHVGDAPAEAPQQKQHDDDQREDLNG